MQALDVVRDEPHRRRELLGRASRLRQHLVDQGWHVRSSQSQIVPIPIGDPGRTMRLSARLRQFGCVVPGIRPPSVPVGQSLLRISLCHGHDDRAIQRLESALQQCPD
jgi:8-amino-7-oxononanoate synthase